MDKLEKQLNKLESVLKAIDADSEFITQQEFEDVCALLIAALETSADSFAAKITSSGNDAFYVKCQQELAALKTSLEAQIGSIERVSRKEIQKAIETAVRHIELQKGDKGEPGIQGEPGLPGEDGSPDTPDDIIKKINLSKLTISKERIDGLLDSLGQMISGAVGITTTFFFKNGTQVGRAKNINIIEGSNITASLYQTGDQMNISISSTGGTGGTAVDSEIPSGSGTSFTIAHTPVAGTLRVFRGGARQTNTVDYTFTGTTITLINALATGEVLAVDYLY